jgi:hypothetical protein
VGFRAKDRIVKRIKVPNSELWERKVEKRMSLDYKIDVA